MSKAIDLFIDSGAHSFYMKTRAKGEEITQEFIDTYFDNYMEFLDKHKNHISVYVNLDVINDPVASYKNYKKMVRRGFNPIAVVHPGEDPSWVDKYIKLGCPYMGLGGLGQFYTKGKYTVWADEVWTNHLTDKDGYPIVKVHGFAMTSTELLLRYPWWSVDSTSWVMTSRMGSIYVPRRKAGKYIYNENSWKITVSSRSPTLKLKDDAEEHIETLSPRRQAIILEYIHYKGYKLGKSNFKGVEKGYKLKEGERWADEDLVNGDVNEALPRKDSKGRFKAGDKTAVERVEEIGLCNSYKLRDELNIIYYKDLEASMPKWPWAWKPKVNKKGFGL